MVGQKITKLIEVLLNFKSDVAGLTKSTKGLNRFQNEQKELSRMAKKAGISTKEMATNVKAQGFQFKKGTGFVNNAADSFGLMKKQTDKVNKSFRKFDMNALGVMFAGMAIQRLFTNIARAAITSFTKIMESNEMLGTAIQKLGVHWEFLKFSVGSAINTALQPLLPVLTDIINKIAEWTQENPKLTAQLVIGGLVIGSFLFLVGQASLAINSIIGFFKIASLKSWAFWGSLLVGIASFIIFIQIVKNFVSLFKTGLPDAIKKTDSVFTKVVKTIVFALEFIMGLAVILGATLGQILISIFLAIIGKTKFMINLAVQSFEFLVNAAIKSLNWLARQANKIPGIDIQPIKEIKLPTMKITEFKKIGEGFKDLFGKDGLASELVGKNFFEKRGISNLFGGEGEGIGVGEVGAKKTEQTTNITNEFNISGTSEEIITEMQRLIDLNNTATTMEAKSFA